MIRHPVGEFVVLIETAPRTNNSLIPTGNTDVLLFTVYAVNEIEKVTTFSFSISLAQEGWPSLYEPVNS